MGFGSLGGRFTTVEGLLDEVFVQVCVWVGVCAVCTGACGRNSHSFFFPLLTPPPFLLLLQLKSLHPFAFGDSAPEHTKMQGFVRQLQEVGTPALNGVKSETCIDTTHQRCVPVSDTHTQTHTIQLFHVSGPLMLHLSMCCTPT